MGFLTSQLLRREADFTVPFELGEVLPPPSKLVLFCSGAWYCLPTLQPYLVVGSTPEHVLPAFNAPMTLGKSLARRSASRCIHFHLLPHTTLPGHACLDLRIRLFVDYDFSVQQLVGRVHTPSVIGDF